MVLVEAVYFGLPVISTPNGGSDMLIRNEENGWILPDKSVYEWSSLIEKIYLEPELYSRVYARLKNEERTEIYWDDLVEKFIYAYQNACVESGLSKRKL